MNSFAPSRASRHILAGLLGTVTLTAALPALATEGGGSVYLVGLGGPQAGLIPTSGTLVTDTYYHYDASAQATANLNGSVQVPAGSGFRLPAQATGTVDADLIASVHILSLTHIFEGNFLGGTPGINISAPIISADLDVKANGVLTIDKPFGANLTIPLSGRVKSSESGVGDLSLTGLVGWHDGNWHYASMVTLYAPTGSYDKDRLVNVGKNHWAVDPAAAFTYLNPQNGRELSTKAGITFNGENNATHYKSGTEFHLEVAAMQHFSENFRIGLAAYTNHQLSGDSGSGAGGDFKGRVYGFGPVVGGTINLGQKQQLHLGARYYNESGAKNRPEGDALFLSATLAF